MAGEEPDAGAALDVGEDAAMPNPANDTTTASTTGTGTRQGGAGPPVSRSKMLGTNMIRPTQAPHHSRMQLK